MVILILMFVLMFIINNVDVIMFNNLKFKYIKYCLFQNHHSFRRKLKNTVNYTLLPIEYARALGRVQVIFSILFQKKKFFLFSLINIS